MYYALVALTVLSPIPPSTATAKPPKVEIRVVKDTDRPDCPIATGPLTMFIYGHRLNILAWTGHDIPIDEMFAFRLRGVSYIHLVRSGNCSIETFREFLEKVKKVAKGKKCRTVIYVTYEPYNLAIKQ